MVGTLRSQTAIRKANCVATGSIGATTGDAGGEWIGFTLGGSAILVPWVLVLAMLRMSVNNKGG